MDKESLYEFNYDHRNILALHEQYLLNIANNCKRFKCCHRNSDKFQSKMFTRTTIHIFSMS